MEEEADWTDYESGPFCRHWGDPCDCLEKCICGHTCSEHPNYNDECDECECKQFLDADESPDTLKTRAEQAFGEK